MVIQGKGTVEDFLADYLRQDGLSKTAVTMFRYLRSIDSYIVFFDRNHCQEQTGFRSSKSMYDGLNELIKHGHIKRTKHGVYQLGNLFIQSPFITIVYENNT